MVNQLSFNFIVAMNNKLNHIDYKQLFQQLEINQTQINIIGQEIVLIKNKIINLMREELNQI